MIQKVGKSKIKLKNVFRNGKEIKERVFAYRDVFFDPDGWADASRFLPEEYDLVLLKYDTERTTCGWLSGTTWEGLRHNPDQQVLYWKRKLEETET